jgi:hypothetical protein
VPSKAKSKKTSRPGLSGLLLWQLHLLNQRE